MKTIALVGQPNVGKSSLLNRLSQRVATVSNYPGTTVETQAATMRYGPFTATLIDTPGLYSLSSVTPEQRVTVKVLRSGIDLIVNVVDASDLRRHLRLTAELTRLGIPMVVVLNQADLVPGVNKIACLLEQRIECPVVSTSTVSGRGLTALKNALLRGGHRPVPVTSPLTFTDEPRPEAWWEGFLDHPVTGLPILALVGYLTLKGVVIGISLLESVSLRVASYLVSQLLALVPFFPSGTLREAIPQALVDGVAVPFGIVLPSMLAVYICMSALEDSGLLARFAVALDRAMNVIGLPGNAIVPLCLALGCRVPALLAIRTMREPRDRFVATALVGIAVPCAASVGMVAAVLAKFQGNAEAVYLVLSGGFVLICLLLGAGPRLSSLALEIPPLRLPRPSNVASKTQSRLKPFFFHVLPALALVSTAVRLLVDTWARSPFLAIDGLTVGLFGIRHEVFLGVALTSIQRYLAPGVLMSLPLTAREATIASAMVVLAFPCLPASVVALKEMGGKALFSIFLLGLFLPLLAAFLLNLVLPGGAG